MEEHGERSGRDELFLTGFGPFADVRCNPSGELARRLDGRRIAGVVVRAQVLSVAVARVGAEIASALEGRRPRLLVGLGVQREPNWRFERRASLPLTATKPDVDGVVPSDWRDPQDLGGPPREWATDRDLETCVELLRSRGVAARTSDDAGGYVCEFVYTHLLRRAAALGVPALFVHVPPVGAMALDDQEVVLARLLEHLAP